MEPTWGKVRPKENRSLERGLEEIKNCRNHFRRVTSMEGKRKRKKKLRYLG